jgi:ABC-type glycerol-3-phosphate transport system substrate-binding protein
LNYRLVAIFHLLLFISFPSAGEDFHYDDTQLLSLMDRISEYCARIPGYESGFAPSGASLLEVLPLMEEVYSFTAVAAGGSRTWTDPALGDDWAEAYLVRGEEGLDLLFRGERYPELQAIRYSGYPLDGGSIEIWLSWEGTDALKAELESFARRQGIEIDAQVVPNPEAKLEAVVRSRGPVPDLVMAQSSGIADLAAARAIQPLDYLDFTPFIPQGRRAFTLDGSVWAVPMYFDTQLLYYNPGMLASQPPAGWTLADLERIAGGINSPRPLAWNVYSSNWLIPFQMSFGKMNLVEPDGRIIVDDDPTADALEYVMGLIDDGLLVPMERDAMDALFIAGEVGMMLSGSYAIPYLESLGVDFGVAPFPLNQETGLPVSPLLDFKALVIPRQTRNPILARRVLQYLTGCGVQLRFCTGFAKLSARQDLREELASVSVYGGILDATIDGGTVIPPDQSYAVYKNTMWRLIRLALSGQMSAEDMLQTGQRLMDADR